MPDQGQNATIGETQPGPQPGTAVKRDLYGSSLTVGVDSYLLDSAHRRLRVTGIGSDENGLKVAADAAFNETGRWHHLSPNLPLSRIRVTRHGVDSAWADLYYRRTRRGEFLQNPAPPAQLMAKFRLANDWQEVYRKTYTVTEDQQTGEQVVTPDVFDPLTGFPNGDFHYVKDIKDKSNEPLTYMWSRPKVAMVVPTFLSFNPVPSILPFVQTLNSEPVLFGNSFFGTGTVMFHGADVEWISHQGTYRWFIDYRFTAVQGGFRKQYAEFDDVGSDATNEWITRTEFLYTKAWGVDSFPAHA
jgi:hypothetical protein